jgi:ADP-heptose:LPS heptosyltransferase
VLLLRTAVAALRVAGHSVSLLAPSTAGAALRGPGPAEVDGVLAWEAASIASLLGGDRDLPPEVMRALAPFEAVVAYTRSAVLVQSLGATGARVLAQAPLPPRDGPHAARWLADGVAPLGGDPGLAPPVLGATAEEEAGAREWLERLGPRFLAVHPGSGSPRKNWPAERFAAVVAALAPDRPWLLAGGPADAEATASLSRLPSVVVARELPVRVLGAVLARAGLYVGNDSGVSHLAAAFGAPTLALFGPTDPAQWAPVGPHVAVVRSPDGTMASLAAAEVITAAERLRDVR